MIDTTIISKPSFYSLPITGILLFVSLLLIFQHSSYSFAKATEYNQKTAGHDVTSSFPPKMGSSMTTYQLVSSFTNVMELIPKTSANAYVFLQTCYCSFLSLLEFMDYCI